MIQEKLEKTIKQVVQKMYPDIKDSFLVEIPRNKNHGDYSTSISLKISRDNAMEIAEKIKGKIKIPEITRTEVLKPGFINFFVSDEYLKQETLKIVKQGSKYGSSQEKGTIVIDYSSPNIAKSFGVGHLRSTIIGQAIYNIYQFSGWKCIGDNHLGDWGTQFGKLIYQIKEKKKNLSELTISELEKLYVDFHKEVQENPEMEDKGRFWFEKLESGDPEAREIWQVCVDISKKEFQRIYNLLKVEIDNSLGESFYSQMIPEVIDELEKKKIVRESENALIVEFNDKMPPVIAVKSDKTTTYLTRDLATIKYRIKKWKPDLIVYEVGADQSLYFRQLFETAGKLKWIKKESLIHVAHGLVRWQHGKFSTRKGETIHLEEVLNQAIDKALKILEDSDLTESEKQETARIVGIGAVKYNDLSQHYQKDIIFDWDKMLNLKGNSGPYIQYTYARCQSVLNKADSNSFTSCFNENEKEIVRELIKFPLLVKQAKETFSPNIIANFLFELSQNFNFFYSNERIIHDDEKTKEKRLIITKAVAQVIENGLKLLGIEAPLKM